jgi:L-lactate dehydrogenase complex protein LldG
VALAMTSARQEILGRIDEALRGAPEARSPVPRDYRRTAAYDDLIALFAERVSEYRANVRQTADPDAAVAAALAEHGASRVIRDGDPPMSAHELDTMDAVVTGCEVAIAETGTIVLTGRQGRRANTLVPDLHVCVVETSRIVSTVPEAMDRLDASAGPVTFIAGPSATSDIELNRVEGVHGPRRLEVIVAYPPASRQSPDA